MLCWYAQTPEHVLAKLRFSRWEKSPPPGNIKKIAIKIQPVGQPNEAIWVYKTQINQYVPTQHTKKERHHAKTF